MIPKMEKDRCSSYLKKKKKKKKELDQIQEIIVRLEFFLKDSVVNHVDDKLAQLVSMCTFDGTKVRSQGCQFASQVRRVIRGYSTL